MQDFITPPKNFPFQPGEVVYQLPSSHRMMSPPPRIRGVVLSAAGNAAYIERADGSRAAASIEYLAYAAYCPDCYAPPVMISHNRLMCPVCGGPVIDQPPPDEMVIRIFPIDYFGWHTAMAMRRAIVNNWTWKQAIVDRNDTVNRAYQRMLQQLGLPKPACSRNQDYRTLEHLKFYAMLDHEPGFLANYFELVQQPVAFVALTA